MLEKAHKQSSVLLAATLFQSRHHDIRGLLRGSIVIDRDMDTPVLATNVTEIQASTLTFLIGINQDQVITGVS